jgi:hypothetical protein
MKIAVTRAPDAERVVTPLERFFDLVYVFAIGQLSHHLLAHVDLRTGAETLIMALAVVYAWYMTTWGANWLDPDRLPVPSAGDGGQRGRRRDLRARPLLTSRRDRHLAHRAPTRTGSPLRNDDRFAVSGGAALCLDAGLRQAEVEAVSPDGGLDTSHELPLALRHLERALLPRRPSPWTSPRLHR